MNIGSFLYLLVAAQVPQTTAERTNYAATSSTADVGAFLDSIALAGAPVRVSEMGSSALGKSPDLHRDYVKAEAPETRASLARVYTTWDPALMVDLHTTDGTLHGYQLTYAPPLDPNGPAGPTGFVRDRMLPALRKTLQDKYHEPIFDYGNVDTSQAQRSWDSYAPLGWYGTNYVGLRGRMAILSEAYSHADFKTRVQVTHDFLVEVLNYVARHGDEIRRLEREADRQTALEGASRAPRPSLAVGYKLASRGVEPVRLEVIQQVRTYRPPVRDRFVDSLPRPLPAGYFLQPADSAVAALLRLHGIQVQRLTAEWTDTVEVLTGTELKWATREFQGHHLLEGTGAWARTVRRVPAGGYFVSTAQPLGRLVFALLEPEGFGLARWGAFSGAPGTQLDPSSGREFPVWRAGRAPRTPSRFLP